ncbi:CoA pyrophosphatase [Elizabethkingia meningoseptica]|uniref:Coenzyme A pyrophosphatase n=1 Tax=Elizabethkingia meningoseptica TaxID=238 RepID=A0A1T3JAV9_ELIME|nr:MULTISPECIES: CoA pyrophosphatase [Elizabethkingia]AQX06426.1 coenzyme A pyrophosphatase [Elizabethkingia meningoseptica]AQX13955.1 coenzyme A pyrophosphatase [Elizabethkingia meningoseptica]AQX48472.1 coenzyme A pyrophosphatase [Elizabethkingia meningoseptica]EJK5327878.1 CoA pyrophosphatase [Elizabethkingia meningoseptica]EOR28716.1 putative nudix hydrolase YeaB [Elizabethkingia meningoseptica ATCC 13253 = NBRC 12535]
MKRLSNIIERFSQTELDGEISHRLYSPPYRPSLSQEEILAHNPKLAAVNILLYPKENQWYFPLIVRSINQHDRHSGQISLPGGKYEEADTDYETTAKRETFEELGISMDSMSIIKTLTPIYVPPSNFYVYAYVSWVAKKPKFILQESEAQELIEMPVSSIFNLPDEPEMKVLASTKGLEVPVIDYNGYIIWGATSMILSEFRDLMKKV